MNLKPGVWWYACIYLIFTQIMLVKILGMMQSIFRHFFTQKFKHLIENKNIVHIETSLTKKKLATIFWNFQNIIGVLFREWNVFCCSLSIVNSYGANVETFCAVGPSSAKKFWNYLPYKIKLFDLDIRRCDFNVILIEI